LASRIVFGFNTGRGRGVGVTDEVGSGVKVEVGWGEAVVVGGAGVQVGGRR
jgi:hypothetical protein